MKIAYIVPALVNKGPVIVVKELVEQMQILGHECYVFYFDKNVELDFPCPTVRIHLFNKFKFENFDIVHSHGLRPDLYVWLHKPICSRTHFLTTLHNYVLRDLTYQYNKLIALICGNVWMMLLKRHDLIIALSKNAKEYYGIWFDKSRLTYAYNTRNICVREELVSEEIQEIQCFKENSILIGVNALLSQRKGVDMLVRSLVMLSGYKLFIVGEGKSRKELDELTHKCKVEDRVMFVGYKKDAFRYLPYYDIFAIPSRSEGFPLAMLEAAAFGIPTVCSDIPIFKEIFTPDEVSFFELENSDDLVRAIIYASHNKTMASLMNKKYQSMYSPTNFAKRHIDIYNSL